MATIKKAKNGYETSPFQKAKQDKSKKELEYKAWLKGSRVDPISASKFREEAEKKKAKMKNGGSLSGLKASTKRDKGIDPKGAWTKVQEKTLAGAKGKAKLTADKQLGATKMKAKKKVSKKK